MSKKKKIYIDFDSTIVNTIKAIVSLYNEDFKYYEDFRFVHWTDINTWTFTECNCTDWEYINSYFDQQRFFDRVEFMDNAKEVLDRLKDDYKIIVVSICSYPNLIAKEKWIEKNMPYAKFKGIRYEKHKDKSHIDMSKSILIDDKEHILTSSNAKYKICFSDKYKWNENWNGKRCYNWTEVEDYIKKMNY